MSALPPKADMRGTPGHVRFGPIADMVSGRRFVMLDTPARTSFAKYKRGRAAIELSTKGLE